MKTFFSNKKYFPLFFLLGVVILFTFVLLYPSFQRHPLGHDIEYLGAESLGRAPFTDSPRYDVYYYGTDLEPEQLAQRFNGQITNIRGLPKGSAEYSIRLPSGEEVPIQFYKDKSNTYSAPPDWAKNTDKRYFFFILDGYYDKLKQSITN